MRLRAWIAAWIVLAGVVPWTAPGPADAVERLASARLTRYRELEPNVEFWFDVFTRYTSRQIVFHDNRHLDLVYSVLELGDIYESTESDVVREVTIRKRRDAEHKRLAAMLKRLASGASPENEQEQRVVDFFTERGHAADKVRSLPGQLRSQRGLGDKFCPAVERARPWLPRFRRALAEHGVPEELASLPLVESGYRIGAHSSVGAAGVWQFTRGTGVMFMRVDHAVDERLDPYRAAEAAARLLSSNYKRLGTWPLAITAYNHGPAGMANAVKTVGTKHLGQITESYRGRTFGFASRNFYAEFLAAHEAMQKADEICGAADVPELVYDEWTMDAYVLLPDLAMASGLDADKLAELNPAWLAGVKAGKTRVPKGYRLNLPAGTGETFARRYASIPVSRKPTNVAAFARTHRVARGQTLSHIASRYGTSVSTLMKINKMRDPRRLRAGQLVRLPERVTGGSPPPAAASPAPKATVREKTVVVAAEKTAPAVVAKASKVVGPHVVGRGQTLSQIARMYGTSVSELQSLNGLVDPGRLSVGQTLTVPKSASSSGGTRTVITQHQVASGESLWTIARNYKTSVAAIQKLNGIRNAAQLRAGQTLKVPNDGTAFAEHRVDKGQTLSQIATRYGTTVRELQRVNGIRDPRKLKPGQLLKVPL